MTLSSLLLFCSALLGFGVSEVYTGGSLSPGQQLLSTREWSVGQTVDTTSGPVHGHAAANFSDVSEYLGIPYAQPPVANLRFQPPVKYTGTTAINGSAFVSIALHRRISGRLLIISEPVMPGFQHHGKRHG
jgi:hypothetical protein